MPLLSVSRVQISDHSTQRAVMWIGDELAVHSFVYWCMNTMNNCSSQEQVTQETPLVGEQSKVTPSGEPPKATTQSDVGPANTLDDMKHESSGVQHMIQVMVSFMHSEVKAHGDCF